MWSLHQDSFAIGDRSSVYRHFSSCRNLRPVICAPCKILHAAPACNVNSSSPDDIFTLTAASGVVKFVMTNGETVEGPELTVELPSIAYIVEMPGEDVEIKAGDGRPTERQQA